MNTLPAVGSCCLPECDGVTTVQVPGPAGTDGDDGTAGAAGQSALTTFTADFTIPAELGSAVATVASTAWMGINEIVFASKTDGSVSGYFQVTAIGGATSVTLKNLEDTATSAYTSNSAPGSIITSGSRLQPGGLQGPSGLLSGAAAGGDLKGTYPNPKISVANTKGSSIWGNGTDSVAVPAGTNGHMLAYDSTDAEGVKTFKALPLTGDTGLADNRILRADGATGLPVPAQPSFVTITDTGAIRADGSGGNARGTDAVDLQVNRGGATQVASGNRSFIGGGENNTASGVESVVGGGDGNTAGGSDRATIGGGQSNTASGQESFIGGGQSNVASGTQSTVGGGDTNTASGDESTIGGGGSNTATATSSTVGGGFSNDATADGATISGGSTNQASAASAVVGGGLNNTCSGQEAVIGGGFQNTCSGANAVVAGGNSNTASGTASSVVGGIYGNANKYGQSVQASGRFAVLGDAQGSELIMRRATSDATPTELLLDGAAAKCTIPANTSWMFQIMLVARTAAGLDAIYKSEGVIRNNAGTTSVNGVTTTEIYDGASLPATPVVVDANDTDDALRINITGIAATSIRWVARVRLVEVNF